MVRNEIYSPKLLALRRFACISGQYKLTWSQITGMDTSERQTVCGLAAHGSCCALSTKCVVFT